MKGKKFLWVNICKNVIIIIMIKRKCVWISIEKVWYIEKYDWLG